ncbi:hypothetical protein GN316_08660 [Xylophilus sp. Kf1]|nr:hypothetical protein [Xylophilus sp. Kf1]
MSTVTDPRADALFMPEPPLWQRSLVTMTVCGLAAGVFIWAAGHHPGGREVDERLAVAECWEAIARSSAASQSPHQMRVACQRLEDSSPPHRQAGVGYAKTGERRESAGQAVAMGE